MFLGIFLLLGMFSKLYKDPSKGIQAGGHGERKNVTNFGTLKSSIPCGNVVSLANAFWDRLLALHERQPHCKEA